VYLLKDGRIGLIDYGQVKELTKRQRVDLSRLLLYIEQNDRENSLRMADRLGFHTEKNDPEVRWKTIKVFFDNDSPESCDGLNMQEFMEEMDRRDKAKKIPEDYVMAARAAIILRGIANLLGHPPVYIATEWKPIAQRALAMYGVDDPEGKEETTSQSSTSVATSHKV
jgi:aarF domain-containing kinase